MIGNFAWYGATVGGTKEAGQRLPNAWGLYDMSGNVIEWCQDYFLKNFYTSAPVTDPQVSTTGTTRAMRGRSWGGTAWYCRSATRYAVSLTGSGGTGFRIVRSED